MEIREKSRINVEWKVNLYDYNNEKVDEIVTKFSKKYGMPKSNIKVSPKFIMVGKNGEEIKSTGDIIMNIQDPAFQQNLFKEYIEINGITDYDFELIKSIDAEINSKIDYDIYDKYRRYSIKWIRWSNFLSYGEDNFFDFTTLKGFTLLNGEPSNQSGKTTFAIDLIHFLLFGKTDKASTLDRIFNKHIPSATEVSVEGCISIDNVDYVIRRKITRPSLSKRTSKSKSTQKVEYYKIVGKDMETLEDYVESEHGESSVKTNKIIKETIGKESDFDLIMSITEDNLDDLLRQKETERGRLLSRWIGLLPLEQKDTLAREKFNSSIKPYLLSNRYNIEDLNTEITAFNEAIDESNKTIDGCKADINNYDKEISESETLKNNLLSAKQDVDKNIANIDIETLKRSIDDCIADGKKKKEQLEIIEKEINEIGEINFSVTEYDAKVEERANVLAKKTTAAHEYKTVKDTIEHLRKSEFCPTCGRKLDNVDNSEKISQLETQLKDIERNGKELGEKMTILDNEILKLKTDREKFNNHSSLVVKKSALEVNISKLREKYKDYTQQMKEYNKNMEAISKNNELDIKIRNISDKITNTRYSRELSSKKVTQEEKNIENYKKNIEDRNKVIDKIKEEEKVIKNWKIYLEMVGKNGVSKMVLRNTLPILNANISKMLYNVCDFNVEISINEKNDVVFYIIKDGIKSDLSSGSGFEKTASALALRSVLANISTIPRSNIVIIDEVWGRVAKENLENVKSIMDRMLDDYSAIILISHLDSVNDWCKNKITVVKKDNISKLKVAVSE